MWEVVNRRIEPPDYPGAGTHRGHAEVMADTTTCIPMSKIESVLLAALP